MSLRLCILASGSSGNCTYVASKDTAILIDAGLSAREIGRRLEQIGASLDHVHGVCVSHEHSDHIAGLKTLQSKHAMPLFANQGTIQGVRATKGENADLAWHQFHTGSSFTIGDLTIDPFSVPHDAMEPVGFVISGPGCSIGVVTDIGIPTSLVRDRLKKCSAIVLESNHDEVMLQNSSRPWSLKQRIAGRQGHLSNARAAGLLAEIAGPHLRRVYLAHLSEECNRPEIAQRTMREALHRAGHAHIEISMTFPDNVSDVWLAS